LIVCLRARLSDYMRICYIAHSDAHYTSPYVDFFAGRGDDVHLISVSQYPLPGAINHNPCSRMYDPNKHKLDYLRVQSKVSELVKTIKPDIVHAHYVTSNGLMAARTGFHPLVISARGSDIDDYMGSFLRRRFISYVMRRADLVNPVSSDLRDKIISLGIPSDKIVPLTQGIEMGRFLCDRSTRKPGPVRLICTRKTEALYQCDLIVRSLVLLAERKIPFVMTFAGTGPEEPSLREQVAQAGLSDRVRFLGGYQPEDLPPLLANADIYISASLLDGTSISLLEAFASGPFSVVSDIQANREWLTGDGDGLLFGCGDAERLAACLTRAIEDERLRDEAIEVNRRKVAERGNRETNMKALARLYDRLLASHA